MSRALFVLATLAACGHPAPVTVVTSAAPDAWSASKVDWASLPGNDPDPAFAPPPIADRTLPNGIRVLVLENHRLPIVSIATIHAAAGGREDAGRFGLAAITADALDEDPAVAAALERAGARLQVDIATDYAAIHATALAAHAADAIGVVAGIVRAPRLLARDLDRIRATRLADLVARDDRARTTASLAFDRLVFGANHPYGHPPEGERATVAAFTAEDVREMQRTAYTPTTTTIIVVGDTTMPAIEAAVTAAFGDWVVHDPSPAPPALAPPSAPVLAVIDRPGATECAIVLGKRASGAGGDRMAAEVANTILGGGVDSRLDRRLRAELHLTSGVGASYWRGQLGSSWSIALATKTVDASTAVREVLAQIALVRTADATPEELARAKNLLARGIPSAFETSAGAARSIERLVVQQRPLDSYAAFRDRIDAVTATAARAAASSWSDPTIVIVGDWAVIGKDLGNLGLPVTKFSL